STMRSNGSETVLCAAFILPSKSNTVRQRKTRRCTMLDVLPQRKRHLKRWSADGAETSAGRKSKFGTIHPAPPTFHFTEKLSSTFRGRIFRKHSFPFPISSIMPPQSLSSNLDLECKSVYALRFVPPASGRPELPT